MQGWYGVRRFIAAFFGRNLLRPMNALMNQRDKAVLKYRTP
jgi:hypothetical protein